MTRRNLLAMLLVLSLLAVAPTWAAPLPTGLTWDIIERAVFYDLQAQVSGLTVKLSWTAPTPPTRQAISGYHVYRLTTVTELLSERNRQTEFVLKWPAFADSTNAGTYYYVVQAILADGSSMTASSPIEVTLQSTEASPGTPLPVDSSNSNPPPATSDPIPTATPASTSAPGPSTWTCYLRLDGVMGEAPDAAGLHKAEIVIDRVSWGQSRTGVSGPGAASGRANFAPLILTKRIDRSSPILALACAQGQHFREACIEMVLEQPGLRSSPFKLQLYDLLVSEISPEFEAGPDGFFRETVTLTYARVKWIYRQRSHQRLGLEGQSPPLAIMILARTHKTAWPQLCRGQAVFL